MSVIMAAQKRWWRWKWWGLSSQEKEDEKKEKEEKEEEKKEKEPTGIPRILSYIIGAAVNLFLIHLIWTVHLPYWIDFNPIRLLGIGVSLIYFGFWGFKTVDVGFHGVPIFLGRRWKKYIFREGLYWILPYPFMEIDEIDVREDIIKVSNLEAITEDNFRVRVTSAAIRFKIVNPFKSLSVKIEVIRDNFDELIGNVLRVSIRKKKMENVLGEFEEGKQDVEDAATVVAKSWGIEIEDVLIAPITLTEEVIDDMEKIGREKIQKEGEKIELDALRERTKEFVSDPDLHFSPQEAREAVQIAQNKITKTIREEKITLSQDLSQMLGNTMEKIFGGKETPNNSLPAPKPLVRDKTEKPEEEDPQFKSWQEGINKLVAEIQEEEQQYKNWQEGINTLPVENQPLQQDEPAKNTENN